MTAEQKAKTPCLRHHGSGSCSFGDKCHFSHTIAPTPPKKAAAAKPPAKAPGGAALATVVGATLIAEGEGARSGESATPPPAPAAVEVLALPAADSAPTNDWQRRVLLGTRGWMPRILATLATFAAPVQQCLSGDPSAIKVEWIDDSGAGRHLGSIKHYVKHFGIDEDVIKNAAQPPSQAVSFYTGGGDGKKAKLALGTQSDVWGECEQHLLDDCPDVRSSFLLVETLQRPRVHWPGSLPFYIKDASKATLTCPEWNKIYADRVDENVPIFSDTITIGATAAALPASAEEEAAPPEVDKPGGPSSEIVEPEGVLPEIAPLPGDQGGEVGIPPPPEPVGERLSREERLRKEANSPDHLRWHFPKNQFCQWCQRGRLTSARFRRKPADPDVVPEEEPPKAFGEKMSTDTFIVSKSATDEKKIGGGGEHCVQTNRDSYSGVLHAYPLASKAHEYLIETLQHFNKSPPKEGIAVKGDNAEEAIKALRKLGWRHDPSLENVWPHNSVHERDSRTWAELLRTNFLSSGLHIFPKTWPVAAEYAAIAFNATLHPPIFAHERDTEAAAAKAITNRWAYAFGEDFPGRSLALGQLVYYRVVSTDKTAANAIAGIFAGWKLDAGLKYRKYTKVLSYAALKDRTGEYWEPKNVHETELFVPEGPPKFPLRRIAEAAVENFSDPDKEQLDDLQQYPLPWVGKELAKGITASGRPRHAHITWNRMMEHGLTDDCKGCVMESSRHSKKCHERFDALYPRVADVSDQPVEEPPLSLEVPAPADVQEPAGSSSSASASAPPGLAIMPPSPDDYAPSEGEAQPEGKVEASGAVTSTAPPGLTAQNQGGKLPDAKVPPPPQPYQSGSQQLASALQRLRLKTDKDRLEAPPPPKTNCMTQYISAAACQSYEEVRQGCTAAMSAACEIFSDAMKFWQEMEQEAAADIIAAAGQEALAAIAIESAYKEHSDDSSSSRPPGRNGVGKKTLIEFCCDANSNIGNIGKELGVEVVRLHKEALDLTNPFIIAQVTDFIKANPGVSIWGSLPCTSWCTWQYMSIHKYGSSYLKKLQGRRRASLKLFSTFVELASLVREGGGEVTFEWPKESIGWAQKPVSRFIVDFGLHEALCDGCAFGMKDEGGNPILKSWRIVSTSRPLAEDLNRCRCKHPKGFKHAHLEGSLTPKSAFYPPSFCTTALNALYPSTKVVVPAMSCVPRLPDEAQPYACKGGHVHRDERIDSLPPSLEPAGLVFETDPEASGYRGCFKKLSNLEDFDLEIDAGEDPQVLAAVTRLLSRQEAMSNPAAKAKIREEAEGLVAKNTWDLSTVTEREKLIADAKKGGVKIHLGQLMSICSEKFAELAEHLRVLKGRIVFRGDIVKDQEGAAAVFQDLAANPTSVAGINNNIAYGMIPGHTTTTADAVKAYVQSLLDSKCATWVQLPPELWPESWRGQYSKPMVLLVKSLYGHPEAGAHWEKHLERIIAKLGGKPIPEFPSSYFFAKTKLLLTVYVDDFTLSGPSEHHAEFWKEMRESVDLDPETKLERILGRHHDEVDVDGQRCLSFNMRDYAQQACDLYLSLTGDKPLKEVPTPFCPEGTFCPADDEEVGELAGCACKVLMKCLWLGRLARPDIIKPIGDLATQVQKWNKNCDKALHRLICYLHSSLDHRLVGTVGDPAESLRLRLYVDADFAGDRLDAKSTSGGFLVLYGENTFFPLAWICKKQTAVSRSTTEAEVISLAHSLFAEALPTAALWCEILGRDVLLEVLEDNEATIKIVKKKGSAKLRHVSRTHRVNLASTYDVFEDPSVDLLYVNTKEQVADIFTKAIAPQHWDHALRLMGLLTSASVPTAAVARLGASGTPPRQPSG